MSDLISRQAAIDAILAVTGNSSVRELYEHVQEHGLSDMWSGGVNAAIDIIIAVPSAQPEKRTEERTEERTETHACDCISRQAVIDTVRKIIHGFFSEKDGAMTDTEKTLLSVSKAVCNGVRELPSAQPERQWIPCSERLPKEDVEVLISYRYKEGEGDTSHTYIDITTYGQMYFGGNKVGNYKHWRAPFEYFESNYEVIAWMPLPEPYERRTDE